MYTRNYPSVDPETLFEALHAVETLQDSGSQFDRRMRDADFYSAVEWGRMARAYEPGYLRVVVNRLRGGKA